MVRKDANEEVIMDNKVLELLELNLKALKKVNPLIHGLFIYYTYFVILYLTGSFLVGQLSRSRCCIFEAIHLSFFVIVMVVARSARRNLEQKGDSSKGFADHDE
jgi:hypothetical protein